MLCRKPEQDKLLNGCCKLDSRPNILRDSEDLNVLEHLLYGIYIFVTEPNNSFSY